MENREKEVQRALGTLTYYVVSLKIRSRADKPKTSTRLLITGSESDASEEAICKYMQEDSTVRRDQISVMSVHKLDLDKWMEDIVQ